MKGFVKSIWVTILALPLFISAQETREIYQRVRVSVTPQTQHILAETGVCLDHLIENEKTWVTGEFSLSEVERIKKAGFQVNIQIPDVTADFLAKNAQISLETSIQAASRPIPPGFNLGSMGGYLTYAEVLLEFDSLVMNYPNLISPADSIGHTREGRPIYAYRVSDNPLQDETEPEVLYTALHHAREPNSIMQMIYYLQEILSKYGTDPEATYLINEREMYVIPMVNPDGYLYNEFTNPAGGGMWRKNRRDNLNGTFGVDLNRNYGSNWGYDNIGSSPNTSSDTYRGDIPFSEPETQAIRDYCNQHQFKLTLNYHTFGNLLIYPYGYIANYQTPDSALFNRFAQLLTSVNNYTYGTGMQTVGYVTNGDSDDWMYSEQTTKNKIMSFTPEAGDPNDGFWPTQNLIIPFCEDNLQANLYHAWLAGEYVIPKSVITQPLITAQVYLPHQFDNIGFRDANQLEATIEIIDPNMVQVLDTVRISFIASQASQVDSFQVILANQIPQGTKIKYVVHTSFVSGIFRTDTFSCVWGQPVVLFTDDFENGSSAWSGGWALTTEVANSPTHCMTDDPFQDYMDGVQSATTLTVPVNLSGYINPKAIFNAQWGVERNYDFVQVFVKGNSGTWTPVSTQKTVPGTIDQRFNQPVFEGTQSTWLQQEIDLNPFAQQTVNFRFEIVSDGAVTGRGYFFDDFQVIGFSPLLLSALENISEPRPLCFPNPVIDELQWKNILPGTELKIWDMQGKLQYSTELTKDKISLAGLPAGVYGIQLLVNGNPYYQDRLLKW